MSDSYQTQNLPIKRDLSTTNYEFDSLEQEN